MKSCECGEGNNLAKWKKGKVWPAESLLVFTERFSFFWYGAKIYNNAYKTELTQHMYQYGDFGGDKDELSDLILTNVLIC